VPKILHVSKTYERITFRNLLGEKNEQIAGWKLKSEKGWIRFNTTNESDLAALPDGKINKKENLKIIFDKTIPLVN